MKTSLLIVLIIAVTVTAIISFSTFNNEFPNVTVSCRNDFIQSGYDCIPDPRLLEPNTVLLYPITDQSRTRITTVPHDITINLEKDNKVTWINQGFFTATVYDREGGTWSTGEFPPSSQKSVQFNNTGLYEYTVDVGDRHHGSVVAISNETNYLPVELRMKMGQAIVSADRYNNPALIGVGSGGPPERGLAIHINEEELTKHDDAEKFYYNMYRDLIPFDVPITIEFTAPILFA